MIAISLNHVSLILGARPIFRDLSWEIQNDQKIGLIGPNGAGKSSLFKLITGEYTPDPGGGVVKSRGITIGCLPQEPTFDPETTALAAAMAGSERMAFVSGELTRVEQSLGDPEVYANQNRLSRALDRQHVLLEEYQSLGGDQYEKRVREILSGLGLPDGDLEKPLGVLSGGQKKLVGLARLILAQPDVLLLDEPDNHLDLAAKVYLERLIQTYPGAVVIISHDRYLLDAAVTQIAELEDGRLSIFNGDYSSFIIDKQQRLARQDELFHVQQRQIARIETAIKRYAMWGKIYDNEKFAKRAKAIQSRLDKMDRIERPVLERRRMDLRLHGWRGSDKVLEFRGVSKTYAPQVILKETNLVIRHGERVGVVGRNGTGKSVLLRMSLGLVLPDGGDVIQGPSITSGYYAQEHETLDPDKTLIETVQQAGNMGEPAAVSYLMRYLFTYRQGTQRVADLSGGERSRLQLALVVLSGANFLLLDEPTNNLDIASAEVLEASLADFEGTVFVVSHDRYFLDQVVDRILVFEEGTLTSHDGGFSDLGTLYDRGGLV